MAANDTTMRFLRLSERAAGTVTWPPTPTTVPEVPKAETDVVPMVSNVEELAE